MIKKLQNDDTEIAERIRNVFQASYKIEAELLKATDFPPLKRPLEKYIATDTTFYGFIKGEDLAGVMEIREHNDFIHIQSLVVHPKFFRQGIGRNLVDFAFDHYDYELFMVETGVDNEPASLLYKKLGFYEVKQWDTDHGIRKVRFERKLKISKPD